VKRINLEQALRVVPIGEGEEAWTIYVNGRFYRRQQVLGRGQGLDLLQVFCPLRQLAYVSSEKGGVGPATLEGWAVDSVFQFLDKRGCLPCVEPGTKEVREAMSQMEIFVGPHGASRREQVCLR
jgi:hypothetical protein